MTNAKIELICVGTELLRGQVNTHQSYLSLALRRSGLRLAREASLPDDAETIAREIRAALGRSDALIVCGGLGPTFDDVTREAAAAALSRRLVYRPALFSAIKKRFARYRMPVPQENKRQAFVIAGATVLKNKWGSAPGQMISLPRGRGAPRTLALLPGPYAELSPMFEEQVLPRLRRLYAKGRHTAHLTVHLSGIPESLADEKLSALTARQGAGLDFTILASGGQVDFHAAASAGTPARARKAIAEVRRRVYDAVGRHIFGEGAETLESSVGRMLRERKLTLSVAESCTGGLVGGRLTSAPGSSDYFKGGAIAYSNDLKVSLLGVSPRTLSRHGAVSEACALEMARGARRLGNSSMGLSVTGVAGPGGGTREKPVGLVFVGLAGPGDSEPGRCRELRLSGGRDLIRQRAAAAALHLLLRRLKRL